MTKERRSLHEIFASLTEIVLKGEDIESRLGRAIKKERAGTTIRDGWPASVGNDGNGGSAPKGDRLSSVERAALLRAPRDRHRELAQEAIKALGHINSSALYLVSILDSLDDLSEAEPMSKVCECCEGKRGVGGDRPIAHRGTVGDRLAFVIDLCEPCYSYVVQSAKPGTRKGKLPSDSQIADHERRGRWRIKVTTGRV